MRLLSQLALLTAAICAAQLPPSGDTGNCADTYLLTRNAAQKSYTCVDRTTVANQISTGTFATNPGTCTNGDVRFPSDSFYLLRCQTNTWVPWGPLAPMTLPSDAGYGWVNQGGTVLTTTRGVLNISKPAGAGASVSMRTKAAPATPWTMTAILAVGVAAVNFPRAGLVMRESGTGKFYFFTAQPSSAALSVDRWTNPTTYLNTPGSYGLYFPLATGMGLWVRMQDDGASVYFYFSGDGGFTWQQVWTALRTEHMAAGPNEIGFAVDANNATHPIGLTVLSWLQQ